MKRRRLYIGISVVIVLLIIGLIGWAIFVGRQQQELRQGTTDLGVLSGGSGGGSSSGGGLFGGVFGNNDGSTGEPAEDTPQPVLRQLYNLPTAGYAKLRSNAVRFVDRSTGHVFEKALPDGSTNRVDQTTVPQVYKAHLLNDGRSVIRQYLDEERRVITVHSGIELDEVSSLPTNEILDIATHPQEEVIGYIERIGTESNVTILNIDSGESTLVFSTVLRGLSVDKQNNVVVVTQKTSKNLPTSALIFDETGSKIGILQQEPGLITKLSPDGSKILYSSIQESGRPLLSVFDIETNQKKLLNVVGLANKCTWLPNSTDVYCALPNELPDAVYPDAWYQGDVSFSDVIWKIDTESNIADFILSPLESNGVSLDMINLTTNASGDSLFFINKIDQTLWSVTIPE